ncbi:hypothetical protein BDF22DRAFT_657200 [Syncephalis plumigaleata]|nr:hypothetical protein BDF22DRAFT_657200 [Syncephalis plumigaleata]
MSSSSNSSSLARKLNEPTIQQTVQQVIEREFNLEILLKRRELSLIRRELDKGEDLLKTLRDIILYNDSDTCNTPDTRSSASKHRAALTTIEKTSNNITSNNNSNSNNTTTSTSDTSTTYRARRTVRAQSYRKFNYGVPKHSQALYARRSDGTYVVSLSSIQSSSGFINHNQLKHENYLGSHDEAIESCGVPVNEEEVPPDHPARFRLSDSLPERLKSIVERGAAREQLKRLKPKIKVFEDILT